MHVQLCAVRVACMCRRGAIYTICVAGVWERCVRFLFFCCVELWVSRRYVGKREDTGNREAVVSTVMQETVVKKGGTAGGVQPASIAPLKLLLAPTVLPENMPNSKEPQHAPLVTLDTSNLIQAKHIAIGPVQKGLTPIVPEHLVQDVQQANIRSRRRGIDVNIVVLTKLLEQLVQPVQKLVSVVREVNILQVKKIVVKTVQRESTWRRRRFVLITVMDVFAR
jgi:hypothetical protein